MVKLLSLETQVPKMRLLRMVAGLTIRERVRSLDIWLGLGVVATPYVKRSGTLHWRFTVGIQLVESQGLAPEDAVE